MHSAELDIVRTLPLFAQLSASNLRKLLGDATFEQVAPGAILMRQGDVPRRLCIVVQGSVELFAAWNARETTLQVIRPVSFFGLTAIRGETSLHSARALISSRILSIPAEPLRDIFERDPGFSRAVITELDERCRALTCLLVDQKLRTSTERLANWILKTDRAGGGSGRLDVPYEKRTLASCLGMTPENLSRNLSHLKAHGVVSVGREILIEDRKKLEAFARPDALIDR
jgi:CRP/FNR family transcriptional activator FtrB